jgi:outer membrane protein TolC
MKIAADTPEALAAARTAEQQVTARYQAGLAQVTDVADAQRVLAQAEVDDAVARVEVWRAELLDARAAGNLTPVFSAARGAH